MNLGVLLHIFWLHTVMRSLMCFSSENNFESLKWTTRNNWNTTRRIGNGHVIGLLTQCDFPRTSALLRTRNLAFSQSNTGQIGRITVRRQLANFNCPRSGFRYKHSHVTLCIVFWMTQKLADTALDTLFNHRSTSTASSNCFSHASASVDRLFSEMDCVSSADTKQCFKQSLNYSIMWRVSSRF